MQIGDLTQRNATGDASAGVQADPTVLYLNDIPGKGQRVFTNESDHEAWGPIFPGSPLLAEEEAVQRFGKVDVVVGDFSWETAARAAPNRTRLAAWQMGPLSGTRELSMRLIMSRELCFGSEQKPV